MRSLPTRALREHPDLVQLRKQAKELLAAFAAGESDAVAEVKAHYRDADRSAFALHDAQLVLARAYGFDSWPKLKAHVDGFTLRRLVDAVRGGDVDAARALLKVRGELAKMSIGNLQVVHHAVLNRAPEMVRLLMEHGANVREGVYPHREATSALTIARERGYDEIVAIIREQEQRQRDKKSGRSSTPVAEELFRAIGSGDDDGAIRMLEASPALAQSTSPTGWAPLHVAARALSVPVSRWLLDHGGQAMARAGNNLTALDLAVHTSASDTSAEFAGLAALLIQKGATLTAPAAVALGDAEWLRARHAEGSLVNLVEHTGGLLRIAASHNRAGILELLLDFGFDPDERTRFPGGDEDEVMLSWGMPLWHCASTNKLALAELLLRRGADPNAQVYASGTPLYQAYGRRDQAMIELLERHGGAPNGTIAGLYRQTELARRLIAGTANKPGAQFVGKPLAEELLWAGACGGDPEVVKMALDLVDWPRDDPRWFEVMEQPLRLWNHGTGHWANPDLDRGTYLTCFRLILQRCDPNIRGRETDNFQSGLTILHSVAASREQMTAAERLEFATVLLDAGARLDARDNLLKSTSLGWACRWGRLELVRLFLGRGVDAVEPDAEAWATPVAWARRMGQDEVLAALQASAT